MKGPTEIAADYLANAKFSDFPDEVVRQGKWCVLDAISCALGGAQTELGRRHIKAGRELGGSPESTLIGSPYKISRVYAAHFNTELANALDFDDIYWLAQTHPGGPIVSSALAIAESVQASGKDFLTAVIASYEICLRVARAMRSIVVAPSGEREVLANSAYCVFGAAAAVCKLMGMDKSSTISALGIAGTTPTNIGQRSTITPGRTYKFTDVKYNNGRHPLIGVFAALRARELSGPEGILDDDWFARCSGANSYNLEELTRGLGKDYRIMEMCFKPMCGCGWTQAPATAVREALKGETISPADIEEVKLIGLPKLMTYDWETMPEAEFSTPCVVAMTIAGPDAGPAWFTTGRFKAPDIRELASKVKFLKDPDAVKPYLDYGRTICTAQIRTRDGKTREAHIEHVKGSRANPFTAEDFRRKFSANVSGILKPQAAEKLWQALLNLEEVTEINALTRLLRPGRTG